MRDGSEIGVVVAIVLIGILFVRRGWAARVVQAALMLGALEWVLTLYELAWTYTARGDPPARMYFIIGSVTAVTLVSALLFQTKTLKETYNLGSGDRAGEE